MTEREKMLRGELYDAYDEELCELREKCRQAVREFNSLSASDTAERRKLLDGLLASAGKNAFFLNVSFDYGVNTRIGNEFSANFNFTVLDCAEGVLVPRHGVYAAKVFLDNGAEHMAVTNVGVRPTVSGSDRVSVESYILDFEGDLYDHTVRVEFHHFIRDERKFSGVDELKAQILRDAETTREYFAKA